MDKRIIPLCVLVILLAGAAGCAGTTPPATPTPSPEPTQSVTPETTTVVPESTTPAPAGTCSSESDCVPAQCCHPTSCTLKGSAPPCEGTMCTTVCSGPLDCGAGSCGCTDGACVVRASPTPSTSAAATTAPPAFSVDASPSRYSTLMSKTPGIKLVPNATGISLAGATFNWSATKGQFIAYGAPDYTVKALGNPATSTNETVYWTFTERASTLDPVVITVVAVNPASSSVIGDAKVTLNWEGRNTVYIAETS